MWSSLVEYHRPATIDKSLRLLARSHPRTVPLAGGTWLLAERDPRVEAVVDLSAAYLAYISARARSIRLGAMTTLQTLADDPIVEGISNGLIRDAIEASVRCAHRNIATIGGTIAVGGRTSEICQALLILDAQVVIRPASGNCISLDTFLYDPARYLLPGRIITEILLPRPKIRFGTSQALVRSTPRGPSIVSASAWVARVGHVCRNARLALGGIAPNPIRLPQIEAMVSSRKIDSALCEQVADTVRKEIALPTNGQPSSEYQLQMAGTVVASALQEAWEQVKEE